MPRTGTGLGPAPGTYLAARDWLAELRDEEAAFQRKLPQLLKGHRGEYVAVYHGRIVAHGPNDEELARQMFTRLGYVPFLIARVEEEPTVYELPSPEAVR